MTARAVLADVAALGPFFTVATEPAEGVDPSWRPFVDLYTDPGPLNERIAYVRRALTPTDASDQVGTAVAASIAFQGLAALLVSAPFGAVVLHGELPELTPQALHWRPSAGGPWPLWCSAPETVPVPVPGPDEAAVALAALFGQHLEPLVAAVRAQVRISERVLWGSVASSVAGAKRLVGMQRPHAAERAAEVARRLLATGRLAGTGELLPPVGPDRYWSFRRRSCCLYYRVPGGGLCEDCVLHARRR